MTIERTCKRGVNKGGAPEIVGTIKNGRDDREDMSEEDNIGQ